MTTSQPAIAQETIDYVAIRRVQNAYADVVNRRAWIELRTLFAPDATVTIDTVSAPAIQLVGPDAVGEFISGAISRFEFFEFVVLNSHIEFAAGDEPGDAIARIFMCELRQDEHTGAASHAYGVYQDRYRRTPDGWRIASRNYQSLSRTGRDPVFPPPTWLGVGND